MNASTLCWCVLCASSMADTRIYYTHFVWPALAPQNGHIWHFTSGPFISSLGRKRVTPIRRLHRRRVIATIILLSHRKLAAKVRKFHSFALRNAATWVRMERRICCGRESAQMVQTGSTLASSFASEGGEGIIFMRHLSSDRIRILLTPQSNLRVFVLMRSKLLARYSPMSCGIISSSPRVCPRSQWEKCEVCDFLLRRPHL